MEETFLDKLRGLEHEIGDLLIDDKAADHIDELQEIELLLSDLIKKVESK